MKDLYEYQISVSVIAHSKLDNEETKELSHLQFILEYIITDQFHLACLLRLFQLCFGWEDAWVGKLTPEAEYIICKVNEDRTIDTSVIISEADWEDIKRIIQYQNDPNYDDIVHLDEQLRKDQALEAKLKNKNTDIPDLERKIWIIAAQTGLLPAQQYELTIRGFENLYSEVTGYAEFLASYALRAKYAEKGKPADHWIWRKKKNRLEGMGHEASGFLAGLGMDAKEILEDVYKEDENVGFKNEVTADEIEEIRRKIANGEY